MRSTHPSAGRPAFGHLWHRLLVRLRVATHGVGGVVRRLRAPRLVLVGYLSYIVVGWVLLCLPVAHRQGPVGALDNLFIATSAVSTTGLVTVSVADSYTEFGQVVVLLLIQLGGIGYMTLGSFIILSRHTTLTPVRTKVGLAVFSLPESFRIDRFVRGVILFTLAIETIGAALLYAIFVRAGVTNPLWSAVFHSISAFCTAGFSLNNDSFAAFAGNFWLNCVIAALSYLGAVGFIVCIDYWQKLRGRVERVTLTTKIILAFTFWLSAGGTALIFLNEPSIRDLAPDKRLLAAFFQGMTALTTVGFNTIDVAALSRASLLVVIVLMVIGASPSGTGGGVKCTTLSAFLGVMMSAVRGRKEVRFWKRAIPVERVWTACANLGFYLLALVTGAYLLELTERNEFEANFFEAASALGTVGLSMGITASLTNVGKVIVIVLMFCGRVGPLTFGAALFSDQPNDTRPRDSDLAV